MNEFKVGLSQEAELQMRAIVETDSDNFLTLVETAKLDKRQAFTGMSFDGMNLNGLELSNFDFSNADFRSCSLRDTVFSDCDLEGTAFSFPPTIRDKWGRRTPNFIIAKASDETVDLMRVAAHGSRQEIRKEAVKNLLTYRSRHAVRHFLRKLCSHDKSKSLRTWLRRRVSDAGKNKAELLAILERSLFSGREETELDVGEYLNLAGRSPKSIAVICQACTTNSGIIAAASSALTDDENFKETLLSNVAHSSIYHVWIESGVALRRFTVPLPQKLDTFAERLFRIEDAYELKRLSEIAAYNDVRIQELFDSCEAGYCEEAKNKDADDFLLYCYFHSPEKYEADVIYHCFAKDDSESWGVSAVAAFGAYCFVNHKALYWSVFDLIGYFYVDPRNLTSTEQIMLGEIDQRFPAETTEQLRIIAQKLREKYEVDPTMKVLRR